jgi:DNA-binding IclR family transcriptional regulator
VIAAVGISGPAERVRASRFKALGQLVMDTSQSISRNLANP